VVSKSPETGLYDAHFGMVMTNNPPVCHHGYESTHTRPPQDGSNEPMNTRAHCAEPAAQSNPRGAQHAPANRPAPPGYRSPVIASYDPGTGRLMWGNHVPARLADPGTPAPVTLGEESWKWLYLQPLTNGAR
jgi:phospholipid/cholesterol/gamma-HCH transport system substrate-binding protein